MSAVIDQAEQAIEIVALAAEDVCTAIAAETAAILERDDYQDTAALPLIGTTNPLTGKPHSATSAAEAIEKTEPYRARERVRNACEADRIRAWARLEQAKLRAALAVVTAGGLGT